MQISAFIFALASIAAVSATPTKSDHIDKANEKMKEEIDIKQKARREKLDRLNSDIKLKSKSTLYSNVSIWNWRSNVIVDPITKDSRAFYSYSNVEAHKKYSSFA